MIRKLCRAGAVSPSNMGTTVHSAVVRRLYWSGSWWQQNSPAPPGGSQGIPGLIGYIIHQCVLGCPKLEETPVCSRSDSLSEPFWGWLKVRLNGLLNPSNTRVFSSVTTEAAVLLTYWYLSASAGVLSVWKDSFFSLMASFAGDVHQQGLWLLPWQAPMIFLSQLWAAFSTMEALNMIHSSSMPPNLQTGASPPVHLGPVLT